MPKRATIAVLALALAAVVLPAVPVAAADDWVVYGTESLKDQTVFQSGAIVVKPGGVLVVDNATIAFNLTQEGGFALQVEAGGSLVMQDCVVRSGAPGLHFNFLVSGHLEVRRCEISDVRGDAGLGGIEVTGGDVLIEDSKVLNSKYYGLFIRSGSPTVRRTTFDTQAVAISVLPGATPSIEDVVIRNATSIGLKVADASPTVRNLTVLGSTNFAIGAIGSTLDIEGCRVSGGFVGVDAVESTGGNVDGCQFSDVGTGVRAQDSPLVVTNSTFVSVSLGVNATRSPVEVKDSNFTAFGVGVRVSGAGSEVYGGLATGNSFCGSGVAFETHTSSFFIADNTYCPATTSLRAFHFVTLEVRAPDDSPAGAAILEITDGDGDLVFKGATDVDGKVTAPLEEFRTLPSGERHNLTPHGVRIDFRGQVTVTTVNATSETTIQITLAPEEPPAPLPLTREGLYIMAAVFALAAVASALIAWRSSARRRKAEGDQAAAARARRRRGPRSGR